MNVRRKEGRKEGKKEENTGDGEESLKMAMGRIVSPCVEKEITKDGTWGGVGWEGHKTDKDLGSAREGRK